MQVKNLNNSDGKTYNVNYKLFDSGSDKIGSMLCKLGPMEVSEAHCHHEIETFVILSGEGLAACELFEKIVGDHDVVEFCSFESHWIKNTSKTKDLVFISFYAEIALVDQCITVLDSLAAFPATIFSTPPTPNGDLHLGHISGPYLAADIYKRFLRCQGIEAHHITGRDDHQTYTHLKAMQSGYSTTQVSNHFSKKIKESLCKYKIHLDYFVEPNATGEYAQFLKGCFEELYYMGYIFEKEEDAYFCPETGDYLHEAFISGQCPYCDSHCDGNACEICGMPNQCIDLVNPICKVTSAKPVVRKCKRLYIRLTAVREKLVNYILSSPMSTKAREMSLMFVNKNMNDICVSHPGTWGVSVPVTNYHQQKIYVWFEMAFEYLWGTVAQAGKCTGSKNSMIDFLREKKSPIIHFYGFDNTFYHTVLIPAINFMLGVKPASAHVVNNLLFINNEKFSTSRNNLIWAADFESKWNVEYIRWFLSYTRPELENSEFSTSFFIKETQTIFGTLLPRLVKNIHDIVFMEFDNALPSPGAWGNEHKQYYSKILNANSVVIESYSVSTYSPHDITNTLKTLLLSMDKFRVTLDLESKSNDMKNYLRTSVALHILGLKIFATLSEPIIPDISKMIYKFLGLKLPPAVGDTKFIGPKDFSGLGDTPVFPELKLHKNTSSAKRQEKNEVAT